MIPVLRQRLRGMKRDGLLVSSGGVATLHGGGRRAWCITI